MSDCVKCGSTKAYWMVRDKENKAEYYCDPCFKKYDLDDYKKEMDEYHKRKKEASFITEHRKTTPLVDAISRSSEGNFTNKIRRNEFISEVEKKYYEKIGDRSSGGWKHLIISKDGISIKQIHPYSGRKSELEKGEWVFFDFFVGKQKKERGGNLDVIDIGMYRLKLESSFSDDETKLLDNISDPVPLNEKQKRAIEQWFQESGFAHHWRRRTPQAQKKFEYSTTISET